MTHTRALALFLFPLACSTPTRHPVAEPGYSSAIIGGGTERGYAAVGALLEEGDVVCTGTLVSHRVVVTAAHCLEGVSASEVSFFIGTDASDRTAGTSHFAESLHSHPDYDHREILNDIGVVVLSQAPAVEPIPWLASAMSADWIGEEALAVGFGFSESTFGEKRSALITIAEIWDNAFYYDGVYTNTCEGDSGGPALVTIDGQTTLIGVTSYGDPDCEEYGVNARVDPFDDFISGHVADTEPAESDTGPEETDSSETVHGIAPDSIEAIAILSLANGLSQDALDHEVPLDRRAAENIVEQRPLSTLAALDAVPYVAAVAFSALLEYAEGTGMLDELRWIHDIEEGSEEAEAILLLVNHLSLDALDDDVPLDRRAAENIVAARQAGPISTLRDLDAIPYVGAAAFSALSRYAADTGSE